MRAAASERAAAAPRARRQQKPAGRPVRPGPSQQRPRVAHGLFFCRAVCWSSGLFFCRRYGGAMAKKQQGSKASGKSSGKAPEDSSDSPRLAVLCAVGAVLFACALGLVFTGAVDSEPMPASSQHVQSGTSARFAADVAVHSERSRCLHCESTTCSFQECSDAGSKGRADAQAQLSTLTSRAKDSFEPFLQALCCSDTSAFLHHFWGQAPVLLPAPVAKGWLSLDDIKEAVEADNTLEWVTSDATEAQHFTGTQLNERGAAALDRSIRQA